MNDKERILMNIIYELSLTMSLSNNAGYHKKDFQDRLNNRTYVHFARYREPKQGDIVLCQTMGMNDWKIGIYEKRITSDEAMIREIGTDRQCRVYNERFIPIDGIPLAKKLEQAEYKFYQKVLKAFRRGGDYIHRFGGVDFDGRDATIWIRKAFSPNDERFPVHIHWNKETTIKHILETMIEQGYGKKNIDEVEI